MSTQTVPETGELGTADPLLAVDDLHVQFRSRDGLVHAVNGVSFTVNAGETLGVIGESGSGKSVTSQAIMGILPPTASVTGEIRYRGEDLLKLPEQRRRAIRAESVAIVFQDALSSLNPVFTVGFQIAELFRKHRGMSRSEAKQEAVRMLDLVRIPNAKERVRSFPHEFSGGMRQRVMIAMALALDPDVLIADEPTTALDVTIQAQVMDLLRDLQAERDMGLILITHDMGVVADVCDEIAVMYAGRVVERAPVRDIYATPAHPYTRALLRSIPRVDRKGSALDVIEGLPPNLARIPQGCSFHPRCPFVQERCRLDEPPLYQVGYGRDSACHYWEEVVDA
ncbi:MAG TPA: ABC transporter ATP-binding protein [Nocardioidaceae bacterium]|jgi:oligopeptide transport system ATP-binding protein|nr:ABC transporter ATP-binding protein [Nocardioidaceae bacterium]